MDLHCFVSFRCMAKWFNCTHMYIFFWRFFSFIGYCKILSIIPVLYRRSLSFIYFIYNSVYQVIRNSYLSFPPHPFPFGNHKFVFCLWVCFCFVNKLSLYLWGLLGPTCKWWYLSFAVWLTSLSMTLSRFIRVAVNAFILFSWLSNSPFSYNS